MNTDESATGGSVRSWVFNCIKINIRNVHMLWVFQCRIVCMQAMTTNDSWNNLYRIPERVQIHVKLHTHIVESVVIETSSGGLVQICGTFSPWFHTKQQPFFTWAVHQPIIFLPGLKSHEVVQTTHWRTMASFAMPFFSSCVRMRTNHLATKCNYYARLLN